jgi:hypothetical protein
VCFGKRGGTYDLVPELGAEVLLERFAVLSKVCLQEVEEAVVVRLVRTAVLDDQGAGSLSRHAAHRQPMREEGREERTYNERFRDLSAFRERCFTRRVLQVDVQVCDSDLRCVGVDGGFDSHYGSLRGCVTMLICEGIDELRQGYMSTGYSAQTSTWRLEGPHGRLLCLSSASSGRRRSTEICPELDFGCKSHFCSGERAIG